MPTMYTIEEHEAQQVKPYIDAKIGTVGNISGDPKTVSYADIVSIKDAIAVNAKDVSIKIEPVQAGSGTPSPDNIRAISGWSSAKVTRCGKNLLNPNVTTASTEAFKVFGGTAGTNYPDGTLTLNAGTYTVSISAVMERIVIRDDNADIVSDSSNTSFLTFTISRRTAIKVGLQKSGDIWNTFTYQLECGSTATEHEPYAGNDYTIDLGGTIYGGTLDVTTGVLTVDKGYANLNDPDKWVSITPVGNLSYRYNEEFNDRKLFSTSFEGLSTSFIQVVLGASFTGRWGASSGETSDTFRFGVYDSEGVLTLSDIQTLATANKLQILYELATPITVQLTPTQIRMLAGVNTVYADTGDTQVEYFNASVGNLGEVLGDVQETALNEVSARAELGAKNFWNDNAIDMLNNNGGTHSSSNGVYTVNTTTTNNSGAYFSKVNIQSFISDYSDKPFLFTCKVKGDATFNVSVGTSDSSQIVELTNTYQTLSIYFANLSAVKSIVFYSRDTSATHVITVEKIMLRLATDSDPTYQPYAMTNKQLTDAVVSLQNRYSVSVNISESVTTILELEQALFDATYGLLTNVGDTCDGTYTWAGHGRYKFSITKVNTNDGQCWFSTNSNMFIGTKTGSNYTCYQISGTAIN